MIEPLTQADFPAWESRQEAKHVVAVDSRRPWVQRWTRNRDGWTPDEPISAGTLQLSCVAVTIDVQALYAGAL